MTINLVFQEFQIQSNSSEKLMTLPPPHPHLHPGDKILLLLLGMLVLNKVAQSELEFPRIS